MNFALEYSMWKEKESMLMMLGSKKEFWVFFNETEKWLKTKNISKNESKRIVFCHRSKTTFSNAENIFLFLNLLKNSENFKNFDKFSFKLNVVTNDWHMLRSVLVFKSFYEKKEKKNFSETPVSIVGTPCFTSIVSVQQINNKHMAFLNFQFKFFKKFL
jgi:hypothetical protein